MKRTMVYLVVSLLILCLDSVFAGQPDIVISNEIISSGQVRNYYGYNSLTVGPDFVMESGSEVYLRSSGKVVLAPGFKAELGSNLHVAHSDVPAIEFSATPAFITTGSEVLLAWDTGPDNPTTTITPDVGGVASNGTISVYPTTTTTYGITADRGTNVTEESLTLVVDDEFPVISSSWPEDNEQIDFIAAQIGFSAVFADNTGIESIRLFKVDGQTETDITSQATTNGNTINYDLSGLEDGVHTIKVVGTDKAGNEKEHIVTFEVDLAFPVTTPSVAPGHYLVPFSVDLTSSEPSTIYYTTDGSTPYEGGPNTKFGESPVQSISVEHSMNLRFYSKDLFGNEETVQSAAYLFYELPAAVQGVSAVYNAPDINISWDEATGAAKYRIYRALSPMEIADLSQSVKIKCAPPQSLRYSETDIPAGTFAFTDTATFPGMTYYYGVTQVDIDGVEGVIGNLVSTENVSTANTSDPEQARKRAMAWLDSRQDRTGFWGNTERFRLLVTSQVLKAYQQAGRNDLLTHQGLFYLRGNTAGNNDFSARKILTLASFGQDVDAYVTKHLTQGIYAYETYLNGWGINPYYTYDPIDTALGMKAMARHSSTQASVLRNYMKLTSMESVEDDKFGWTASAPVSVYASCLVYNAEQELGTTIPDYDSTWILTAQNQDGSFGDGVIDTAAVLLWIDGVDQVQKEAAINYLISQQTPYGSWDDDEYITGFCLEALLK